MAVLRDWTLGVLFSSCSSFVYKILKKFSFGSKLKVRVNLLSSVQSLSHVWLFAAPWTAVCQASLSITNSWSLLKLMSIESVMPSNHSSSVVPFSSCPQSFLASGSFPVIQFFTSGGWSIGTSASASVLPMNILVWFPLGLTDLISLQTRDSQESSWTPHVKNINSLALSFLYGPTLISIHDCWKNHSFY